jgi:hypothetical protein
MSPLLIPLTLIKIVIKRRGKKYIFIFKIIRILIRKYCNDFEVLTAVVGRVLPPGI